MGTTAIYLEVSMTVKRRTILATTGVGAASIMLSPPWSQSPAVAQSLADPGADPAAVKIEAQAAALTPPMFLLETTVPKQFRTDRRSSLAISSEKAKVGSASLLWEHAAGAVLTINEKVQYEPSTYRPGDDQGYMGTVDTFCLWVYNEVPTKDCLRIEFGRGATTDTWTDFKLNFSGWRTAWIRLGYDTEGAPHRAMNQVRFVAPPRAGRLFIDQVILNTEMRPDHPTPDRQVPSVNAEVSEADNKHWLALLALETSLRASPIPAANPTGAQRAELAAVRERYIASVTGGSASAAHLGGLLREAGALGIPLLVDPGAVAGALRTQTPGKMIDGYQTRIFPEAIRTDLTEYVGAAPLRKVTDLMFKAAQGFDRAKRSDAELHAQYAELYLRCFVQLREQGFAPGSALGTIHHIGYQYQGYWNSLILVRELLVERGIWEDARENMEWFAGIGRLKHDFSDVSHYSGLVDVLNTLLKALVGASLMRPTEGEQVAYLLAVKRWCDGAFRHSPGLAGGFKPDGSMFHHMGLYPDYGRDGLKGSVPIVALLSGTSFGLSRQARGVVKNAILTLREHANTTQWPLSLAGRHPDGTKGLDPTTFGQFATAGADESGVGVDSEVGAAYLRLLPANPSSLQRNLAEQIRSAGVEAEPAPSRTRELGYGACVLHRRNEWLLTVRGHNRYLWATEIYDGANMYGRYSTYGTVQVQARSGVGGQITHDKNGFLQPGWNWNRWPGTTAKHLPFEKLRVNLDGAIEEMVLTESAFGGGGALEKQYGIFGMDLREHPFHDPSHRVRSSVFLFDDRAIALGSGISNTDPLHPTETTLFQVWIGARAEKHVNSWAGEVNDMPYSDNRKLAQAAYLVDPVGNGFYVPAGQRLVQQRAAQTAPDQKGQTEGTANYATAVLDHGTAPDAAGYEYALVVQTTPAAMAEFTQAMASADSAPYRVLRRDDGAHVVSDHATGVTGYVFFEPQQTVLETRSGIPGADAVAGVDRPALVMSRMSEVGLALSVTDPDLHLYEGKDPDQYDDDGTFVGRVTSYSRPWRRNPSAQSTVVVTLDGAWQLPGGNRAVSEGISVKQEGGRTLLTVTCRDALSVGVVLTQA